MPKLYGMNKGTREIVLTFDDGPHPKLTPKLLDTLAKHEIKAVFFVIGQNIATVEGRRIVERTQREGHMIGNHTYSHPNLRTRSAQQITDEIRRTHDLICECAGGACTLFRPPYGAANMTVSRVLRDAGYMQVLWNVDTMDWKYKKDAAWIGYGMTQIKAREDCIVLMHDIHPTTVNNVEEIIKQIKRIPKTKFMLYE